MRYDAIVIGAGPGGSSCAALLAQSGLKVLLAEKNDYVGGKAGTFEQFGHRTDFFTHIPVLALGQFGHTRQALEIAGQWGVLEFMEDWPSTLTQYGEMSFAYPQDLAEGEAAFFRRLGLHGDFPERKVLEALETFLKTLRGFTPENLESLRQMTLGDITASMPRAVRDGADISALLLFVVSAKYASAGETIEVLQKVFHDAASPVSSFSEVVDVWNEQLCYPRGGIGQLSEAFTRSLERSGGELRLSSLVESIAVEDGEVKGVYIRGQLEEAGVVVSNAGIQATALKLVGNGHLAPDYLEWARNLRPSFGSARIRYFLDKQLTPHGLIIPYGSQSAEAVIAATGAEPETTAAKSEKPSKVGTMIVCPSNFDPEMSPAGKQVIIASCATTADYRFNAEQAQEWFKMIHATVQGAIPGIDEHIEHMDYATSDAIARMAGRYGVVDGAGGECIGVAQVPGQIGEHRPDPAMPLRGLYCAGADTGQFGIGVDLAIGSGVRVAELVQEYIAGK